MPLIIPSNSITGGYEVANSLRFDDGSTDYLDRTPASTSDRKTATFSSWIKFGNIITEETFFSCFTDTNNQILFQYQDHRLRVFGRFGGTNYFANTSALYRDPSAWYHIVIAFDTTQGTASNRMRLYVNGNEITNFNSVTYPSSNAQLEFNTSSVPMWIGAQNGSGGFELPFDGYMAEVCWIDGSQLDPTSFGEFDANNGIWKPIDVSGLTFGTNGFYLDFENSGSLGADVSGNGNNFTVNNLTSIDQTTDTPTNNFATLNTLDKNISNVTLSDGNLTMSTSASNYGVRGTMGVVSGKWYWEVKVVTRSGSNNVIAGGIAKSDWNLRYVGNTSTSIGYAANGLIYSTGNNEGAYGATYTTGDIIGVALDMDSLTLTFYKNGVSQGAVSSVFTASDFIFPAFSGQTSDVVSANFGSPTFTISSGNSDGNGMGNFEYAVPSGYYSLNTKNLSEFG
jgi:hypothetical protein